MKLHDLLLRNFWLKLFSLLMAVLLWETIHLATKREPNVRSLPANNGTNQAAR